VQDDGAGGRATHAAIRDAHDVLHTGTRQLARDRDIARLGHARRSLGTDVLQHQNVLRRHVQVVAVDPPDQVLDVLEHHRAAFMLHQQRVGSRLLDDGAAGCEVATQHGDATLWIDRLVEGSNHVLPEPRPGPVQLFAQGSAGDRHGVQVEQRFEFAQQRRHAPGVVEIFHVVLARRLQVEQHGRLAPHAVERGQIDLQAHAPGNGRQVHDAVGRAADGEQDTHGIFERLGRQYLVDGQAAACHLHSLRAGLLGNADAVGCDRRR